MIAETDGRGTAVVAVAPRLGTAFGATLRLPVGLTLGLAFGMPLPGRPPGAPGGRGIHE